MDLHEALERTIASYERYYTVEREAPPPFAAMAEFRLHTEQYFLVKSARYAEINANEYVYFALSDAPTRREVEELAALAWRDGTARVKPDANHRSSDVVLVLLAGRLSGETAAAVQKIKYYQSYRLGLRGWSHFRMVALEPPQGNLAHNRQGRDLAALMRNIFRDG